MFIFALYTNNKTFQKHGVSLSKNTREFIFGAVVVSVREVKVRALS